METIKNTLEEVPTYSLSEQDFSHQPVNLTKYSVGDPVKRDNFISFLVFSFALSRGSYEIQEMFFSWIKARYGFDSSSTMRVFNESGGWKILSDSEKELFLSPFKKISGHENHARMFGLTEEEMVTGELKEVGNRKISQLYEEFIEQIVLKAQNYSEFNKCINIELQKWKDDHSKNAGLLSD